MVEFVAATTRNLDRLRPLLSPAARREAEEPLSQFVILYPTERLVRTAIRGCATDGFGWFDAHLWAYAEDYSLTELVSEDFEHGGTTEDRSGQSTRFWQGAERVKT